MSGGAPLNHWVSMVDEWFVEWHVSAPDEVRLTEAILKSGEEHEVFRVATIPLEGGPAEPFDYLAHVRAGAPAFEFDGMEAPAGRRFAWPGRVCWHGPSGIEEAEVAELGPLLRELRSDLDDLDEGYLSLDPPIDLWRRNNGRITIGPSTDIWFPGVVGFLDDHPYPGTVVFDNVDLALRHTPRLNAFLRDVRVTAERLGGTFELVEHEWPANLYADQVEVAGIRL